MKLPTALTPAIAARLLAFEAGGEALNWPEVTAAAIRVHEKLFRSLAPVIGDAGYEALFARTLALTRRSHAGLEAVAPDVSAPVVFGQLRPGPGGASPEELTALVTTLLDTFIGLLSNLIGKRLAWRLVAHAWPDLLPSAPPPGEDS